MDLTQLAESIGTIANFSIWYYFRFALAVAIAGWAVIKVNSWLFNLLWNRGYDKRKHLLAVKRIVAMIVVIVMALEILQVIHDHSPLLAVLLLVAILTILVYTHRATIGNLTAGIALLVHNKIKMGYRITTTSQAAQGGEPLTGVVESIEFVHTIIRLDDGGRALIPHNEVFGSTTVIELTQPGYKVEVEVECPKEAQMTPEKIEQMIRSLPYRQSKSKITVAITHIGNPRGYKVTFFVWSPDVVTVARNSFYEAMATHMAAQLKARAAKSSKSTLATKAAAKAAKAAPATKATPKPPTKK